MKRVEMVIDGQTLRDEKQPGMLGQFLYITIRWQIITIDLSKYENEHLGFNIWCEINRLLSILHKIYSIITGRGDEEASAIVCSCL